MQQSKAYVSLLSDAMLRALYRLIRPHQQNPFKQISHVVVIKVSFFALFPLHVSLKVSTPSTVIGHRCYNIKLVKEGR